jgi:hypothetical protein
VVDASVADVIPAEVYPATASAETKAAAPKAPETLEKPTADPKPKPETATPAPKAADQKPEVAAKQATPTNKPEPAPKPAPASKPAPAAQNGFLPLALGGLVAGVIGFALATFTAPQTDTTLPAQIAAQARAIDTLKDQIAAQADVDLGPIDTAIAELTARIAELEARPATIAAPSADVSGVNADMDVLRAQIAEMTTAAQTELAQARAAAASIEENAAAAARNAAARAALARVQTALESGSPIGAALGDLEEASGADAPVALIDAQEGVPTLASLQDTFPDAARAALATARSEGVAGEQTSGLGAFLRNQFDVRSTAPRDGDGADAILSRAEAAIRAGRLSDALAEISALPEVARAEMSGWLAQAELRANAVAAVDILSSSLSDN